MPTRNSKLRMTRWSELFARAISFVALVKSALIASDLSTLITPITRDRWMFDGYAVGITSCTTTPFARAFR